MATILQKCIGNSTILCGLNKRITSWFEELEWTIERLKEKALLSIVLRVAWKAIIYHIWKERNRRIDDYICESPIQLVEHVREAVRLRTIGLKKISMILLIALYVVTGDFHFHSF